MANEVTMTDLKLACEEIVQMGDPRKMQKVLEVINGLRDQLSETKAKLESAERELRFAAGMISTMPQFADKHPEAALQFIKKEALKESHEQNKKANR